MGTLNYKHNYVHFNKYGNVMTSSLVSTCHFIVKHMLMGFGINSVLIVHENTQWKSVST